MIRVVNYTNFFNRELLMYSMGDIKFKKPISLKKAAYILAFLLIWTIPWYMVMGLPTGVISALWMVGVPIGAGTLAARPLFGGMSLLQYLKTLYNYLVNEPKGWADGRPMNHHGSEIMKVENELWISRRREIFDLADEKLENWK